MLQSTSVKTRFFVSVGANGVRALIGFISSLLVARGLNPAGYGDLMFLIGSFAAIRSLLDMGTSNAFYTFLSRHTQGPRFYVSYFAWLALQFAITLLLVSLIIPASIFEKIWLDHNREIVIIAFLATFMQQQVWQTVTQIGESMRKTVKVQLLNLFIAMTYLLMTALFLMSGSMMVVNILLLIIVQYVVATLWAFRILRDHHGERVEKDATFRQIAQEYWVYCKPMIVVSIVGVLYDFADKWMLQRFGGASQQGYFQIASQFAAISLLATTSILNIFWKEIAEAWAQCDHARVAMLYNKVSRGLVMVGAIITGFLLPWSKQIVAVFLGSAYLDAWPVLAVMLLYPIHQSMGQIGSVTLMASGNVQKYMIVRICNLLAATLITYFVLAPPSGVLIPGLGLGAIGMALKTVMLGAVLVNIQAWFVARYCDWKYDWVYQAVGIPLMIVLGYVAKMLAGLMWNVGNVSLGELMVPVIIASLLYALMVATVIRQLPWLIGSDRDEIQRLIGRAKAIF